jgi:alkaline phosphatase D
VWSAATGIYDPSTPFASWSNVTINALCVLGSLDFVYRIHHLHNVTDLAFCRTGEATSTTTILLCRSSSKGSISLSVCDPLEQCRQNYSATAENADLATVFELSDLVPNTRYSYSASIGQGGSFVTCRRQEEMQQFSLLSSSCIKPNWPYSPFNHPLKIQGLEHLGRYLSVSSKTPELMLFLGDFICESMLIRCGG